MANHIKPASPIPPDGYLRLDQIIGQKAVTEAEAEANRAEAKRKQDAAKAAGLKVKNDGKPKRSRQETAAIIPVSKASWWAGVKSGRYPQPVKLGPRTTAWRASDIRALVEAA